MKRCLVCGYRIDPAAGRTHPACDDNDDARDIRTAHRKWQVGGCLPHRHGVLLGQDGIERALAGHPGDKVRGMAILRQAAERHETLSADTVRERLDDNEIPHSLNAGLFSTAEADGWLVKLGEVRSGGLTAHGKKIITYRSRVYRAAAS